MAGKSSTTRCTSATAATISASTAAAVAAVAIAVVAALSFEVHFARESAQIAQIIGADQPDRTAVRAVAVTAVSQPAITVDRSSRLSADSAVATTTSIAGAGAASINARLSAVIGELACGNAAAAASPTAGSAA